MDLTKAAPFLRWAGSKRKLLSRLVPYWGSGHRRYIEPFMGSASLFFRLAPRQAILSDLNIELVETFKTVRNRPNEVYDALSLLPCGKIHYYTLRNSSTQQMNEVQRCARFIFLNRFCFNGLFRTNKAGAFNVPYAPTRTGDLPNLPELLAVSDSLCSAQIRQGDFESVLAEARKGDFIYLDPPYAVDNRRVFRQYGPTTFGLSDLIRLAMTLRILDAKGATFVLSYAYCSEALTLMAGWNIKKVLINRNISGFAKHRRRAAEVIISNIR